MDSSTTEKHHIYQIFRACRLCGAGAGYKMPIIQNVELDSGDVELKHKIRECVQIEVHQEDKMPPLICELCVDKVNDFYEFLEMCRQTNKSTRLRLGLPPQTLPRGAPDAGDCILGVTEPVFLENEDSNEPISKSKSKSVKNIKIKKEYDSRDNRNKDAKDYRNDKHKEAKEYRNEKQKKDMKKEGDSYKPGPRSLRRRSSPPPDSPPPDPRNTRGSKRQLDDDVSSISDKKSRRSDETLTTPKSILKREKESKSEEIKTTRSREKENEKIFNAKKVKIMVRKMTPPSSPKPTVSSKLPPSQTKPRCQICRVEFDRKSSLVNHMRTHVNKSASPPPKKENKKIECKVCERQFLHKNLLDIHRCNGKVKSSKPAPESKSEPKPSKPSLKPPTVKRVVPTKKKVYIEPVIDPEIKKQLQPLQVRISKCDPLLENKIGDYYDASDVDYDYGLDKTCVYPYIYTFRHLRIKSEPSYMVNISDEIKNAFDLDDETDVTDSDLDLDTSAVKTLKSLALKAVPVDKLDQVPKKSKKVKAAKAFDSILNSNYDSDLNLGISNIINRLDDDKDKSSETKNSDVTHKIDKTDSDSLFGDDNSPAITNSDFDTLFDGDVTKSDDVTDKSTDKDTKEDSETSESNSKFDDNKNDAITDNDSNETKDTIESNTEDCSKNSIDNENDSKNDNEESESNTDSKDKDDAIVKDVATDNKEANNDETHVNGQTELPKEFNMDDLEDVSDTDMEDGKLMEAIDNQISESGTANVKTDVCERDKVTDDATVKSTDLESVSDGDFE
ncbi:uncharacterized protein LOC112048859 [Bicyclus anynana]|uniref:Uncharacterized protein LOC112048859 n=1 Tax=Bicyclus anynana TaxID=110368 RepID=A0ABM3M3U8_BICAN|nr:uncharacterized protein LOC112048859 [Bicyclus anynana]